MNHGVNAVDSYSSASPIAERANVATYRLNRNDEDHKLKSKTALRK